MTSKTTLPIILLLFIAAASCTSGEEETVFTLDGKLPNADQDNIYLYQAGGLNANDFMVVDTLAINNDSTFSGSYSLEPHFYELRINDSLEVNFVADAGQQISIQFSSADDYEISGSPDTDLFEEYEAFRMDVLRTTVYPIRNRLDSLLDVGNPDEAQRIEELGTRVLAAEKAYRDTLVYAVEDLGTSIAIYPTMVRWNGDEDMEFYKNLAEDFSAEHEGLEVAELVSEKVRILEQVSIGGQVQDIVAPNPSGEQQSLYDNMGTVTLIDFFGSWCGPCRSESDHLGRMYAQYNDSGFEIYGFGIEFTRESWLRALEQDNRIWTNVSTVDGYESETAAEYAITSLPKNFLVDEEGIIVAKDIHGDELEAMIVDMLGGEE